MKSVLGHVYHRGEGGFCDALVVDPLARPAIHLVRCGLAEPAHGMTVKEAAILTGVGLFMAFAVGLGIFVWWVTYR